MRNDEFDQLAESVRQAGKIRRGELKPTRVFEYQPTDIKAIRLKLGKSQSEFALMIGVSVSTPQNWEQGRRSPGGSARALLKVTEHDPEAVAEALDV